MSNQVSNPDGFPELFDDISCPSVAMCVAVDFGGNVATSTDPTGPPEGWSNLHVDGGNSLVAVSCPSESFCAAVDSAEYVVGSLDPTQGAASWTAARTGDDITDLSCPSVSLCVAVDNQANIATSTDPLAGPAWTVTHAFPSGTYSGPGTTQPALSCTSTSFCAAVVSTETCGGIHDFCDPQPPGYVTTTTDPAGGAADWTGTTLPTVEPVSVSCPTGSFCAAGDLEGDVITSTDPDGGADAWSTAHVGQFPVTSISCPSPSLCVAIDENGDVLSSTDPTGGPRAWRSTSLRPIPSGGSYLTGVSCASSSLCVVVDGDGYAFTSTDPTGGADVWAAVRVDDDPVFPGLSGVSCPSTRQCIAAGQDGSVIVGTAGPPQAPSLSLRLSPRTSALAGRLIGHRCVALSRANRQRRACTRPIRIRVGYTLTIAARVRFTLQRLLAGRWVRGRCKMPTRANRHHRACTKPVAVHGAIVHAGAAGPNSFTFTGRIAARRLGPGTYRLTATPTASQLTGAPRTATFRILR